MTTTHNIVIKAVDKTGNTFKSIGKKLGALGGVATGVAAGIAGIAAVVVKTTASVDVMAKRIDKLGVTSARSKRNFQILNEALKQGGINAETMDRGMRQLMVRVNEGATGTGGYADAVSRLGDDIFDANGNIKDSVELFELMAEKVRNGTMEFNDFKKLVGEKAGPEILAVLRKITDGTSDLDEALQQFANDATIISPEMLDRSARFQDQLGILQNRFSDLFIQVSSELLPTLQAAVQWLTDNMPMITEKVVSVVRTTVDLIKGLYTDWTSGTSYTLNILTAMFEIAFKKIGGIIANGIIDGFNSATEALLENPMGLLGILKRVSGGEIDFDINLLPRISDEALDKSLAETQAKLDQAIQLKNEFEKANEAQERFATNINNNFGIDSNGMAGINFDFVTPEQVSTISNAATTTNEGAKAMDNLAAATHNSKDGFSEFGRMTPQAIEEINRIRDAAKQAAEAFQNDMVNGIENASKSLAEQFVDGIMEGKSALDMLKNFLGNTLKQMAVMIAQQNVFQPLLSGFANMNSGFASGMAQGQGLGGTLASMGASLFRNFLTGGMRADGGTIGSGQIGLVGERGPELVRGPATVTSNRNSANLLNNSGGDTFNVTYNVSAIDSKSGTEFLAAHNKDLVAIIDKQRNRRGLGGITR